MPLRIRAGLLLALLCACWSAAAGTPVRLATFVYPPYMMADGHGGVSGPAVRIVRMAFARAGYPVSIAVYPIQRGRALLVAGSVDGYFTIRSNPERRRAMRFPHQPLLLQDTVFFVRRDAALHFNGHFSSLADAHIGVVSNVSYGPRFDRALRAGRFRQVDYAVDHEVNFRKLLAGRVDAVVCSRQVGQYYLRQLHAVDAVVVSGPPVEATESYLVFGRGTDYTDVIAGLDRALADMREDGSLDRLLAGVNQ